MFHKCVGRGRGNITVKSPSNARQQQAMDPKFPLMPSLTLPSYINVPDVYQNWGTFSPFNVTMSPTAEDVPEMAKRDAEIEVEIAVLTDANLDGETQTLSPPTKEQGEYEVKGPLDNVEFPLFPAEISKYYLIRSVGPGQFYMIREEDKILYDEFQNEMQASKNDPARKNLKITTNMMCGYFDRIAKQWCRVVLDSISSMSAKSLQYCSVYNLEQGRTHFVFLKKLRSIPERFVDCKWTVFHCFLSGVIPSNGNADGRWSRKAVKYFKTLMTPKTDDGKSKAKLKARNKAIRDLVKATGLPGDQRFITPVTFLEPNLANAYYVIPMNWIKVESKNGSSSTDIASSDITGVIIFDMNDNRSSINRKMVASGNAKYNTPGLNAL